MAITFDATIDATRDLNKPLSNFTNVDGGWCLVFRWDYLEFSLH